MLKKTRLSNLTLKVFRANQDKVVAVGSKANKIFKNLSKFKKSKNKKSRNLTYILNIKTIKKPTFLNFKKYL